MIDLWKGIAEDVVQNAMQNIHNNLAEIAKYETNHRNHTFSKHIDKDDEYLINRIENGCHSATSYYSEDIAKNCINSVLYNKWHVVARFLLCKDEEIALYMHISEGVGYGYLEDIEGVFEDCHLVCVVLEKDINKDWGFSVKTSYPIITRDLTPELI